MIKKLKRRQKETKEKVNKKKGKERKQKEKKEKNIDRHFFAQPHDRQFCLFLFVAMVTVRMLTKTCILNAHF